MEGMKNKGSSGRKEGKVTGSLRWGDKGKRGKPKEREERLRMLVKGKRKR